MRILLDYRPALRQRTGVGEYVHELARALSAELRRQHRSDRVAIFSSSWKDRPSAALATELPEVECVDWRIPVRTLTYTWNRLEWPPVESLAGPVDLVHAQSPLLIPARRAAQVITIHDLDFLNRPDRARAEMRRDFPQLVRSHAHRAHAIVVSSAYAAGEVARQLEVPPERIAVCAPGPPGWADRVVQERAGRPTGSTILFMGTVEPRKNVGGLLDAYLALRERHPAVPPLVIAGRVAAEDGPVARLRSPAVAQIVQLRGYVSDEMRPALYRDARMLVLPSFEEGFGLPVLEAMACGVPVVISNRGSLPEVAGAAAEPVDPDDVDGLATRMGELLDDDAAEDSIRRGRAQAATYSWSACARAALDAYSQAIARRTDGLA